MTAQKGRDLILQIHDGSDYETIGGFRTNSFTINNETADVSTKDSGAFRQLMADTGLRQLSTSGNGVFLGDAQFEVAHGHAMAGTHPMCKIMAPGLGAYTGAFAIRSLDMAGNHNGEVTYNIALESAGDISFTPAA